MLTKQEKLKQAIQLQEALKEKNGGESFLLLAKLDKLEDEIAKIKTAELKDEEISVEVEIV
jgi:hypothetical protein